MQSFSLNQSIWWLFNFHVLPGTWRPWLRLQSSTEKYCVCSMCMCIFMYISYSYFDYSNPQYVDSSDAQTQKVQTSESDFRNTMRVHIHHMLHLKKANLRKLCLQKNSILAWKLRYSRQIFGIRIWNLGAVVGLTDPLMSSHTSKPWHRHCPTNKLDLSCWTMPISQLHWSVIHLKPCHCHKTGPSVARMVYWGYQACKIQLHMRNCVSEAGIKGRDK